MKRESKNPRTLRSKKLRAALFASADCRCKLCGAELPASWHADHVVPFVVSQSTNVHEMQALCQKCNLTKGSKTVESKKLRRHQSDMDAIGKEIAVVRKRFRAIAHIVCGGGKSWLPGILMNHMPTSVKLCWAVPRLALQEQAVRDTKDQFGLSLRDSGNEIDPSRGRRGVVVTHQSVCQAIDLWKHEFSRTPYVLLVDEPHHAKVSRSGEKNELAKFMDAVEPLCFGVVYMTGTLSTGDNKFVYGIRYSENEQKKEEPTYEGFDYSIRYTREDGLNEEALVPIEFHHHDGLVKWESMKSGGKTQVVLSQAEKDEEGAAIWTALNTELANAIFERGYKHWKVKGNKLLVVCHSQSSARKWHNELLKRGENSFLAISENEDALPHINQFKSKSRSVLVTCAMAYEGLDEKKLSHVVCLTHIRSVPWIEQMLARVWRADTGKKSCFAFVPDDPRMQRVIEKIKAEQPDAKSMKEGGDGPGPGPSSEPDFIPVDSKHEFTRMSALDIDVPFSSLNERQLDAHDLLISLGIDPEDENFKGIMKKLETKDVSKLNGELTDGQREIAIRNRIATLCRQVDVDRHNGKFGTTQKSLFKRNQKKLSHLTLNELQRSLDYVESLASKIVSR